MGKRIFLLRRVLLGEEVVGWGDGMTVEEGEDEEGEDQDQELSGEEREDWACI